MEKVQNDEYDFSLSSQNVDRSVVLGVSSTSWTPDEDFSVLLSALVKYNQKALEQPTLPKMVFIITGKGPDKERFLQQLEQLNMKHVYVCPLWLEHGEYPLMLGLHS